MQTVATNRRLWTLLVFGALTANVGAARGKETFTDAAKAGPDFAVQGEFVGADKDENKLGAQIIALGDAKFHIVGYLGGLPGDGWKAGDRKKERDFNTRTENGKTEFLPVEDRRATLIDGKLTLYQADNVHAELKRVERKSPTLGAKPPAGAIVLFDGKNVDEWKGGRMTDDGLLRVGVESKRKFNDCTIHLEFRLPFQPKDRGQGRANSGLYVHDCYEIQVLDSFGLKGENNECGGLYTLKAPDVNMCYPPLAWQSYDIDFTAPQYGGEQKVKNGRLTLKHNGVAIHDDYELPKASPGRAGEGPGPRPIHLQDHGNPVVYRNIWVVEKR